MWDMCATAALVEQVQQCRETYGMSYFLLYMLFINYCFIHSFTAVIFLKQKLPSSIVPIQMPDHGRVRLALGHNMMFMSTYSIPLGGEKILIHGWSQIMKARPSWRIGQKIMFMLFHGSKANIQFIDHVAR